MIPVRGLLQFSSTSAYHQTVCYNSQVKMFCHQTKPGQPHRYFLVSFLHQVHKCGEVVILVKDVTAAIAPVQEVASKATSGCSWHDQRLVAATTRVK